MRLADHSRVNTLVHALKAPLQTSACTIFRTKNRKNLFVYFLA